jgi:hypothetical protein
MRRTAQAVFDAWQSALKVDTIPQRASEMWEQVKITQIAERVMETLRPALKRVHRRRVPRVRIGALAIWDFAALVSRSRWSYCVAVGIGSVRLLDLLCAYLCVFLFDERDEVQEHTKMKVGAVCYDYVRRKIPRLRHWIIDPYVGFVIPYGLIPTEIASIIPNGREDAHRFYLHTLLGWILAHEIAHVMAGDVGDAEWVTVMGMTKSRATLSANIFHPESELEADFSALCTMVSQSPEDAARTFTAVCYFLCVLDVMERLSSEPVFSGHSHPPPAVRLEHLVRAFPRAAPHLSNIEAERIAAIGSDFLRFLAVIPEVMLENFLHCRAEHPLVSDGMEEYEDDDERIYVAAARSNEGHQKLADGDLERALELFREAEATIHDAPYGEGHGIIWTNLVHTAGTLGRLEESLTWLRAGVAAALQRRDKPVVLHLLRVYGDALRELRHEVPQEVISELHRTLRTSDPDIARALAALGMARF